MKVKKVITSLSLIFISLLNGGNTNTACKISDDVAKIENILKRNEKDIDCMLIVANKYLKEGELSKGFMYISKAYELDPNRVKKDKSAKVLDMALSLYAVKQSALKTDDIEAWNYLGDRYFKMKVFPEAKSAYENSLRVDASQDNIRILYAITLYSLNQHYRAVVQLKRVLKNNQNDVYANYYMAKILKYSIGDTSEAMRYFRVVKELLESKKHNLDNKQILSISKDLNKELL